MLPSEMLAASLPCEGDETKQCLNFYVDGVGGDDFFNGISANYATASLCAATTSAKFLVDPNALDALYMDVVFRIKDADLDFTCFDGLPFSANIYVE